ncbi:MAG: 2TM domain-containing protein [Candidatus Nanopelagicales bacterium]|nr:2TM domain-containing protein [Candidatus Nanopelagicales bacterium]
MEEAMTEEDDLRKAALNRVNARRNFWRMVGVFVIVNLMMIAIWWMSGKGTFWPVWVMFGTGIAVLFSGLSAFGPGRGPVTDSEIEAEVRKMKGEG